MRKAESQRRAAADAANQAAKALGNVGRAVTPRDNRSVGRVITKAAAKAPRPTGVGSSARGTARLAGTKPKVARPTGQLIDHSGRRAREVRQPGPVRDARARDLGLRRLIFEGAWDGRSYYKHQKRSLLGIDEALPDLKTPWDPATNKPDKEFIMSEKGMKFADEKIASDPAHEAGRQILAQTMRPIHAIASAADYAVTGKGGKSIEDAALRGLKNENNTTFSDVLKHAGAPKAVQSVGGFALDVGLDPTTYVTFGVGSVARKGMQKAAVDAEKRALAQGLTKEQAKRFGQRAAAQAARKMKAGKGVTVKVAGKELPGVRRASGAVGRTVKKTGVRVPAKMRAAATEVRPSLRPAGADEAQFQAVRQAAGAARAETHTGRKEAAKSARVLEKNLGPSEHTSVIQAVESGNIAKSLKAAVEAGHVSAVREPELAQVANRIRSENRGAARARRQSGVSAADVRKTVSPGAASEYFPHQLPDGKAATGRAQGATPVVRTVDSMKRREGQKPLAAENVSRAEKGQTEFSTDVPLVQLKYQTETRAAVAQAKMVRRIAEAGTVLKIKDGRLLREDGSLYRSGKGEQVYVVTRKDGKYGLHPAGKTVTQPQGGHLVALNKDAVDHALQSTAPVSDRSHLGRGYDRASGVWKGMATATPGFYVRNLLGEHWFAYTQIPGQRIPKYERDAMAVLRQIGREEKHTGMKPLARSGRTIKIRGENVPVDVVARAIRENGGARTGYVARDIGDQLVKPTGRVKRAGRGATNVAKRAVYNIEDIGRVMSSLYHYDKGGAESWAEAVRRSLDDAHIDYGDLTKFERRVAKRVAPFYTFSARTIPNTAKALAKRPGKFANYEKLRTEIGKATGVDINTLQEDASDYQRRSLGIPLGGGGPSGSVLDWGSPIQMLNELPIPYDVENPSAYLDELGNFAWGLVNPILKVPTELLFNQNSFFRNEIDKGGGALTAAPAWAVFIADHVPGAREAMGIKQYKDSSGKTVAGWPPRFGYIISAITPGLPNQLNQILSEGTNRAGMGTTAKVVRQVTGLKASPVDGAKRKTDDLYARRDQVARRLEWLRTQGISKDRPTAEYTRLLAEQRDLTRLLNGDKKKPKVTPSGAPPPPVTAVGSGVSVPPPPKAVGGVVGVPPPPK